MAHHLLGTDIIPAILISFHVEREDEEYLLIYQFTSLISIDRNIVNIIYHDRSIDYVKAENNAASRMEL